MLGNIADLEYDLLQKPSVFKSVKKDLIAKKYCTFQASLKLVMHKFLNVSDMTDHAINQQLIKALDYSEN